MQANHSSNSGPDSQQKRNLRIAFEQRGERASNYVRLFLIAIFILGTAISYVSDNLAEEEIIFYIIGIGLFSLSLVFVFLLIRTGRLTSNHKYFIMLFEHGGIFTIMLNYIFNEQLGIPDLPHKSVPLNLVWCLIVAVSVLRFSPRFCIVNGLLAAAGLSTVYILALQLDSITMISGRAIYQPGAIGSTDWVLAVLFLLSVGFAMAAAAYFSRQMVARAQASADETGQTLGHLQTLIGETRNVADELNGTAQRLKEITVSNNDLSRDQMAAIEETSATMEQMSSSTRAIADQARHQDKLSDQNSTAIANLADLAKRIENLSREASEQGKRTMDYARNGQSELSSTAEIIAGISERSARITEFVTVINDIADKTNLLALNAAIEAARAGEEGRGFSVVADEVGKLAELSSQNAREIGALIRDSSSVTEDGVQSIQRTLEAIEGILKGIKDIAAMNAEVYTLVQDQTQSSSEVNGQMQKIQMFAREMRDATAEQLQGASEILSSVDSLSKGSEEFMQGSEKLVQEGQKLADLSDRLLKRLRTFESSES